MFDYFGREVKQLSIKSRQIPFQGYFLQKSILIVIKTEGKNVFYTANIP